MLIEPPQEIAIYTILKAAIEELIKVNIIFFIYIKIFIICKFHNCIRIQ